jgi:hypothetical protein
MKKFIRLFSMLALSIAAFTPEAFAQLNIPGDGSDGALVVNQSTNINLSQATTGSWTNNNATNAGNGIYDPSQWAVVFKYSSVTIQGGATVTFSNHPSRAPVVWLVSGNVVIDGTLSLNGQQQAGVPLLAEPGPGGFRGGVGNIGGGASEGAGFGPGAFNVTYFNGIGDTGVGNYGQTIGFNGFQGSPPYGNPSLIPLIGGSGGYGSPYSTGGGAGGGAILIACANTLTVTGTIQANGGYGWGNYNNWDDGGSGGGIRLVANAISGSGTLSCNGGGQNGGESGGFGRIRIERVTDTSNFEIAPDASLLPLTNGNIPNIFMPTTGPFVAIETIGGLPAPADPRSSFGALGADVTLPQLPSTTVTVLTTNVEAQSVVTVRVTPRSSGPFVDTVANVSQTLSQSPLVIRWTANVPVSGGYNAIIAHVVRP